MKHLVSEQYFLFEMSPLKKVLKDFKNRFCNFKKKSIFLFEVKWSQGKHLKLISDDCFFFSISFASCCLPPCCVLHFGLAGAGCMIFGPFLFLIAIL